MADLYFLLADETQVARPEASYYCYAGLVLDSARLPIVDAAVAQQRTALGLEPAERLKFADRARPTRISRDAWRQAKSEVMAAVLDAEGYMLSIYVHLRIAAGGQLEHWAFDNLALLFNDFLASRDSVGLMIFDHSEAINRPDVADVVSGITSIGAWRAQAPRVLGVATTHVEWLHAAAAADISIGSLRYCLEKPEHDVSKNMFEIISRLVWSNGGNPPDAWMGRGFTFLPRRILWVPYSRDYNALKGDIRSLYWEASSPF